MKFFYLLIAILFSSLLKERVTSKKAQYDVILKVRDTTILINNRAVTIYFPSAKPKGVILMLPGWNYSRNKTCEFSSFCKKALDKNYALICPEMGKSLYGTKLFSETKKEWRAYPQLSFITDTLLSQIQKQFHFLLPQQNNFIYGISTGARGVALILENTKSIFKAGALLSGDYDQRKTPEDNLIKGYYGPYHKFKSRWEGLDNPYVHLDKINAAVYIGHGQKDKIVAPFHSKDLYEGLKKAGKKVEYSQKEKMGHDFSYWESETSSILNFFEKNL